MSPAEHYAEAERLLLMAVEDVRDDLHDGFSTSHILAEAQVHATLATAAGALYVQNVMPS